MKNRRENWITIYFLFIAGDVDNWLSASASTLQLLEVSKVEIVHLSQNRHWAWNGLN